MRLGLFLICVGLLTASITLREEARAGIALTRNQEFSIRGGALGSCPAPATNANCSGCTGNTGCAPTTGGGCAAGTAGSAGCLAGPKAIPVCSGIYGACGNNGGLCGAATTPNPCPPPVGGICKNPGTACAGGGTAACSNCP